MGATRFRGRSLHRTEALRVLGRGAVCMGVEAAVLDGHRFIVGPGLDEVLEQGYRLVLLDEFYGDMYGDYVFLGYDVYHESIAAGRGDLVGLYTAGLLLSKGPSVVVCGEDPRGCLAAATAYRLLARGGGWRGHARDAWRALREIYPGLEPRLPAPLAAALEALERLLAVYGSGRLGLLMSLGESYGYGWGRLHYGESLAWTLTLGAPREALLAASLHFLAEGPGEPGVLLSRRLEALGGVERLREALGDGAAEAVQLLRRGSPWLELVEALGPGGEAPVYVEGAGGRLLLYCGGPVSRQCLEAASRAERLAEELLSARPRLVEGEPPSVELQP